MDESSRLIEIERPPVIETAVLVRLALPSDAAEEIEESLSEMRQLAWTAGADVKCTFVQYRPKPCSATLIGSGKADEIKAACEETEANLVIFDSDLSPAQASNLEKILDVKVVDRTQLILDIFAQRAHTNEGKHQVELAQLQYLLPRLAGRGSVMRQQGGIGVRGPGEQKLEVDRRHIRRRIERLQDDIESVRKHRSMQRKRRTLSSVGTVALVGYTNAGKSSLLNALTRAGVFVEDKLFATLDPRVRRVTLPSKREIVLADTVGFIRKLPHSLVAAFRATLEEVNDADLLLLVADAAHPAVEEHIRAVNTVLEEIKATGKPIVHVLNKIDLAEPAAVKQLAWGKGPCVAVSAVTGEGLDALLTVVDRELSTNRRLVLLRIPQSQGAVVARIHDGGHVLDERYEGADVLLEAELDPVLQAQLATFIVPS